MADSNKRFWFAQVPNPKTKEPHWVRVSSAGRLNDSTYAVFKVRNVKDWRQIEAPTLSDARTMLLGGKGTKCNAATVAAAAAAKAKAPPKKPKTVKGKEAMALVGKAVKAAAKAAPKAAAKVAPKAGKPPAAPKAPVATLPEPEAV